MRSSRRITFPGAAIGLTCLLLGAASAVWAQTSTDSPLLRSQRAIPRQGNRDESERKYQR